MMRSCLWHRQQGGCADAVGTISASMRALRSFGEFIVANVLHVPGTVYDLTSHTLLPNATPPPSSWLVTNNNRGRLYLLDYT